MHLRRALLLFAIVLGLAAVAASVSRSPEESDERAQEPITPPATKTGPRQAPRVAPGDAPTDAIVLVFESGREQTRNVEVGQPATLLVEVDEPGQVAIPDLGLSSFGDPLTPARFEVLASDPGRHEIEVTPAAGDEPQAGGTLVVKTPDEQ